MRFDRVTPDMSESYRHFFSPSAALERLKPDLMLPKISGLYPWLRMIAYCCVNVMMLLAIQ